VRRIQEAGQLGAIYADVRRSKALITAVRSATVTDASGAPVDLSDLIGDDDDAAADQVEVLEVPAPEEDAAVDATGVADDATGDAKAASTS